MGKANPGQARQVKCYNCNGLGHIARNCTQPKRPQNSEYFKDKMLLMQAQENGVILDERAVICSSRGGLCRYNMTPYDQYVKDNAVPVVQNKASKVPNDAYVMIDNDLHESDVTPELLEYAFGTCPKVFNQQDKKHANTPRKKQVTFADQCATSSSTTHNHVEPMHTQKSNVPVPPSTGVNSCTVASGSQPRSILKKHRIPPAKSDSLEKVEDHSRTIRSSCKTTNRVDSSISSKRTVFGALCYPTNDSEDLGKLQPTADIRIFVSYAPSRKGYIIYNKRTRQIMKTIHVTFDELTEQMAPLQSSPGPAPNLLTPGPMSSRLVPNPAPAIPYIPPTNKELEMLFQPMFDEYFNLPGIRQNPIPNVAQDPVIHTGPSVSIAIDLDAPSGSHTSSPLDHHSSSVHHGVAGEQYAKVNPFAVADHEPFAEASTSREITIPESNQSTQPHEHIQKWIDSHPIDNIIGNPLRPVSTRK
ncbi:retrovirus-related pol polyprotein from transposon TNT 1-94 [Tanacetum coccineum]